MALIPYEKVPGDKDPTLSCSAGPVRELYCGDPRCDCNTGHLLCGVVPFAVDIGTGRVDFLDPQADVLHRPLRLELEGLARTPEVLAKLRAHYYAVRRYGEEHHFEYMDWTGLRSGDLVPWQILHPRDRVALLPILKEGVKRDAAAEPTEEQIAFRLGLGDRYCVEQRCDCQRVLWEVVAMAPGDKNAVRPLGTVTYDFRKDQPAVREVEAGVDPDQLLYTVLLALRSYPGIVDEHEARYKRIRQLLIPLAAKQRRERDAVQASMKREAGRNDPCPCGSGKKYKKCHGAKAPSEGSP